MSKTVPQSVSPQSAGVELPPNVQRTRWIITLVLQSTLVILVAFVLFLITSTPSEPSVVADVKDIHGLLKQFTPNQTELVVFEKNKIDTAKLTVAEIKDKLDEFQNEIRELRKNVPPGTKGQPLNPDYEAKLNALDMHMKKLSEAAGKIDGLMIEVKALPKYVPPGEDPNLKKFVGEAMLKTGDQVASILTREFKDPIAGTTQATLTMQKELSALSAELRHEGATQDIAIVVYHAGTINAGVVIPAIEEVVLGRGPRSRFRNYRLGVHLAANGQIVKTLLPFNATASTLENVVGEDRNNVEQPSTFDPSSAFPAQTKYERWQRRCVFVVSSNAIVPNRVVPWDGIAVDVILWDDAEKLDLDRFREWSDFCRNHRGMVIPLTRPTTKPVMNWLPGDPGVGLVAGSLVLRRQLPFTLEPFKVTLQRLVNPF